MICVSISSYSQLRKAVEKGASLLELRLDLIREDPARLFLIIPDPVRTIATCRPSNFSDEERFHWLRQCMDLGAAYVDLELESEHNFLEEVRSYAHSSGTEMILSYHNYEQTPDRETLQGVMLSCYEKGGVVAKVATQTHSQDDLRNLLSLYDLPGRKVILGMGQMGRISRLVAPYLGSEFTFASPEPGQETAAGQFGFQQLMNLYKEIDHS